jgi:hypothetical protein
MADYCYDCFKKTFPDINPKDNDLVDLVGIDEAVYCICEGCGAGWFDRYGKRINVGIKTLTKERNCPVCFHKMTHEWVKTTGWNGNEDELHHKCDVCGFETVKCGHCGNEIEIRSGDKEKIT